MFSSTWLKIFRNQFKWSRQLKPFTFHVCENTLLWSANSHSCLLLLSRLNLRIHFTLCGTSDIVHACLKGTEAVRAVWVHLKDIWQLEIANYSPLAWKHVQHVPVLKGAKSLTVPCMLLNKSFDHMQVLLMYTSLQLTDALCLVS